MNGEVKPSSTSPIGGGQQTEGKNITYAQIAQKKKEEREAKEAAAAAAAAAATKEVSGGQNPQAKGEEATSASGKKNVKDTAVKSRQGKEKE